MLATAARPLAALSRGGYARPVLLALRLTSCRCLSSSRAARSSENAAAPLSTTARGTAFEVHSAAFLESVFGMALMRVGGAGDGGVDLRGWWTLPGAAAAAGDAARPLLATNVKEPSLTRSYPSAAAFAAAVGGRLSTICAHINAQGTASDKHKLYRGTWRLHADEGLGSAGKAPPHERLRVIVQCKAEAKKLGPVVLRELEGALHRQEQERRRVFEQSGSRHMNEAGIGVLCSSAGFSKQTLVRALGSSQALLLVHLENAADPMASPTCVAAVWNAPLAEGLLASRFEIRWLRGVQGAASRLAVYCDGVPAFAAGDRRRGGSKG